MPRAAANPPAAIAPSPPRFDAVRGVRAFAAALFIALVALSTLMNGPIFHQDEGSYLLNAAALAGRLSQGLVPGYYSGYSLLIAPAFAFFTGYAAIYHWALVVNAALLATLPFALQRLLGFLRDDLSAGTRALAACAASCQVALLTNSQLALSDNLLVPLYAWMLAAGGSLLFERRASSAAFCGALAGALFVVHPRGGALAAVGLLALSAGLRGRGDRRLLLTLWLAATLVALLHVPLERLALKTPQSYIHTYSTASILAQLLTPMGWAHVAFTAFGAFTYAVVASFGLVVLALRLAIARWRGRFRTASGDPHALLQFACVAGFVGALLVTGVYFNPPDRADQVIYGRYALPTVIPLLALGLAALSAPRPERARAAWWAGAVALASIVVMGLGFRFLPQPPPHTWVHVNIIDLYIPFVLVGRIDWPTIAAYFLPLAFTLHAIDRLSPRLAVAFFAAANLCISAFVSVHISLPSNASRQEERQLLRTVREFERSAATPLCVSISAIDTWHSTDIQNWLYDRIEESSVVDRSRCVRAIIGPLAGEHRPAQRFRLIDTDRHDPYGLFVQKSTAVDRYVASHAVPPADFPSPLPDASRRAEVVLDTGGILHVRADRALSLHVHLRNVGTGSNWPAAFDAEGLLAVRVGARAQRLGADDTPLEFRADLPRSLGPGDSAVVEIDVGPFHEPGRYSLGVGAMQEAVAWFDGVVTSEIEVEP